ncbi:hypothetical protein J6590_060497 [Homalodisca vitripennis]|nr:hypothetical protein J6590_060497 [Homalodisca vitripennis]
MAAGICHKCRVQLAKNAKDIIRCVRCGHVFHSICVRIASALRYTGLNVGSDWVCDKCAGESPHSDHDHIRHCRERVSDVQPYNDVPQTCCVALVPTLQTGAGTFSAH